MHLVTDVLLPPPQGTGCGLGQRAGTGYGGTGVANGGRRELVEGGAAERNGLSCLSASR